jgi:uncharacterized membrane protein YphA (DoxX/SURF4 family)
MNVVQQIIKWEQPRHKVLFLTLRVTLGLIIVLKGIIFIRNFEYLNSLLRHSSFRLGISFWVYYIGFAHLLGGIFIIMGLLTRVAVLLQVPVLAGAVFFINHWENVFSRNGEFILSLLVLCMLFYFLAKGSGEVSVDRYLKNHLL